MKPGPYTTLELGRRVTVSGTRISTRRVFAHSKPVDTNGLVKACILEAPDHETARGSLESANAEPEPLRISRQDLREYLALITCLQTWPVAIAIKDARDDLVRLSTSFEVLVDSPVGTDWLLSLCREVPAAGRQSHNVKVVPTMLVYTKRSLLIFNSVDFRRYGDRIALLGG